mgnify:FL=1
MEARIHLQNLGFIENHVFANLTETNRKENESAEPEIFTLSPKELIIEPYNFGTLTITFRPEAIQVSFKLC